MSTKYIASNWRLPNEENSNKSDNYGLTFSTTGPEFILSNTTLLSGLTSASISMWLNIDSISATRGIFSLSDGAANDEITLSTFNSRLYVRIRNASTNFKYSSDWSSQSANTWIHLCLVYDGSETEANKIKVYLNNSLINFGSATGSTPATLPTFTQLTIGNDIDGNDFNGSISEVAIFDYALSSTQISTLYGSNSLGAGNPMALKPKPVAYYPLGDNSASNPLTQPNEAVEDASVFDFVPNDYIIADVDGTGGSDSSFELGSDLEFTVSFWFNRSSSSSQIGLFQWANALTSGSPFLLIQQNSNNLRAFYDGGYRTNIVTLQNIWYHISITRTASDNTLRGYLNGSEWFSYDDGGTPALQNVATSIYFGNGYGNYFTGKLSNGQVWNTALSDSEIETLYNSGVPLLTGTQPQASNLKAWYKLDQSANWEADSSGAWQIPDAVSAYPQSFDFDGTSDIINFSTIDLGTTHTISMWVKITATSFANIITGTGGSAIKLNSPNRIYYYTNNYTNTQPSISTPLNQWNNIVIVRETTTVKFYVNNSLLHTTTSFAGDDFTFNKILGLDVNNQTSNIQLWDSALPATGSNSIETLYNNGVPLTTAIASDNLKLWSKLDNTATFSTNWSIPDASGNGNTGTSLGMTEQNLVNNNVSALNGESNGMTSANLVLSDLTRAVPYDSYSFNFDSASSDYIQTTSNSLFNGLTAFSISCWIKRNGAQQAYACILTYQTSTSEYLKLFFSGTGSSDKIEMQIRPGSTNPVKVISSAGSIPDGEWVHIAVVGDANNLSNLNMYINGVLDNDVTSGNITTLAQSSDIYIGTDAGAITTREFNGKISNICVFNEALTSTEVLKLYSNGVPQDLANFTPAPVAWYPLGSNSFWNGSQWTVIDMIGSNDGTGQNIGVDGLVGDAPRSEANGTGTNMDIESNITGSTKWSSNNSWSINMSSTARVEDTP